MGKQFALQVGRIRPLAPDQGGEVDGLEPSVATGMDVLGWQWAASTGCDAQPYFRIFNPVTQSEKFDPDGRFIRRYVPELAGCDSRRIHAPWLMSPAQQAAAGVTIGRDYPRPVVDHAAARQRAIEHYKAAMRAGG